MTQPALGINTVPALGCFWAAREQKTVHLWPWRPDHHRWPPTAGARCLCGAAEWSRQ